jgi:hypothetical protein
VYPQETDREMTLPATSPAGATFQRLSVQHHCQPQGQLGTGLTQNLSPRHHWEYGKRGYCRVAFEPIKHRGNNVYHLVLPADTVYCTYTMHLFHVALTENSK